MKRRSGRLFTMAFRAAALAGCASGIAGVALAEDCGSLESHYGPYDYRVDHSKRPIVENFHFTPKVEALVGGQTTVTPGQDLEYVLKTFPNHPRALVAATKWARIKGTVRPPDFKYSVDCHFERALRFRSDDVVVRMLFAQWLGQTKRKDEGLRQLATIDAKGNPQTLVNLGLLYAELGALDQAVNRAHEADAIGADIGRLRAILEKAGVWREPAVPVPASGASSGARS